MKIENVVIKQSCHSRNFLSGIFHALSSYVNKEKALCIKNKYVEDPRLQPSGMTALFNNGGFTLIELLVVVLIIGILAAMAVPQYQKAVRKSRLAKLQPLVHALANAAEVYYVANGKYPSKFDLLDIDLPEQPTSADLEPNERGEFFVYFPWGKCKLTNNNSTALISCYDGNIAYTKVFNHSLNVANARFCSALNKDPYAYSTCQTITGYTPSSTDNDDIAFPYP